MSVTAVSTEERKNKRIAFSITSALFGALLLLCFIWIIMVIPDPLPSEIAEGGVEVDYGYDAQGSGDVQSLAPANNRPPNPNAKAGSPPQDPKPVQESSPITPPPQPASSKANDDESVVTSNDPDSKEEVKTNPEPKKEVPRKNTEVEKTVRKPVEATKPANPTPPAPKVEEKPKVDQRALFKKTDKPGAGGTGNGTSNQTAGNNNGDDAGKVGDKGDPRGIMGSKNYSGKPGTGGGDAGGDGDGSGSGISARITGWNARISQPNADDLSSDGFVIFKVYIDEDGRVEKVLVEQATLPPQDVALCKSYVQKGKYTPKEGNEGGGVGTVRFTIKAR